MRVYLFAVVLLALSACSNQQSTQAVPTPTPRPAPQALAKPTYKVQRGEVIDKIEVSGFVSARQQQELAFTQNGFLKVVFIERGAEVKEGDVLAELDQGELPNQLRQAEVAYEQAKLVLDRAGADRESSVRRARLDLADAQGRLAKLTAPPDAATIASAQASVNQARANVASVRTNASADKTQAEIQMRAAADLIPPLQSAYIQAQERWNDVKDKPDSVEYKPRKTDYLQAESNLRRAERDLEQAKLTYETAFKNEPIAIAKAEAELAQAEAALRAAKTGPKATDLAAARRDVERAQIALEEAQRSGGSEQQEQALATAQLEKERIEAQIASMRLLAPFTGKIAEVSKRPGDAIEAYKPVITIMNDTERELLVESVTSQDANKIGVGMPVTIIFSRHPGQTFNGVITKLPTSLTSSASTIDKDPAYHIDYTADVPIEVGDLGRVTITLAKKDNVLWLPPEAVRAFEGRRFVVLQDGERQRRKDVRVGIISTDRVEILEEGSDSLKEGDVVIGQ